MKKLYRSKDDRIFFGVCGGLAEYFEIDAIIVRLIFVILTVWGGAGILIYLVALVLMPEKGMDSAEYQEEIKRKAQKAATEIKETVQEVAQDFKNGKKIKKSNKEPRMAGLILIILGLLFLTQSLFPTVDLLRFWPLILVFIGMSLIAKSIRR